MQKLPEVEEAKALFTEARDWGVWKWLTDKARVRKAADLAWEALDTCEQKVKAEWGDELRKAWREAVAEVEAEEDPKAKRRLAQAREAAQDVAPEIKAKAHKLLEADDEAYEARTRAEDTFIEAEKKMSASLARDGCSEAIEAWEMREKLIRKFEAARKG